MSKKRKEKKKLQKKRVQKVNVVKEKEEKEAKVFTWYFPFLILFILLLSFSSFLFFLFSKNYKEWEKEFENSSIEIFDYQNEKVDLDEKIEEYNNMQTEYAFIEFTKEEALFLFSQALDESMPEWFNMKETALETERNSWKFFAKGEISNFTLPWFQISLAKEPIQSVDIYIDDIFFGNLSFRNLGLESVVENSNRGLSRAIKLINDGNFAGRVFENIELTEDSLIIRSRNI